METEELIREKGSNKHRFICSDDGGNILTLYARIYTFRKTRLFDAINLFQCDKCKQFYAMDDGTNNLIPLIILRKNVEKDNVTLEDIYKILLDMKKKVSKK